MLSRACTAASILGERGATSSRRPLYFGIDLDPMQVLAGSLRRRRALIAVQVAQLPQRLISLVGVCEEFAPTYTVRLKLSLVRS